MRTLLICQVVTPSWTGQQHGGCPSCRVTAPPAPMAHTRVGNWNMEAAMCSAGKESQNLFPSMVLCPC